MLKRFGLAVMTLALIAALAGGAAAQQSLTWTAGAVGGGWYTISGAWPSSAGEGRAQR